MTIDHTQPAPTEAPEPAPTGRDTSNDVHLFCCNPNKGLCGENLTDGVDAQGETLTCSLCDLIDEADSPCGARLCRLRQKLRMLLWFRRAR